MTMPSLAWMVATTEVPERGLALRRSADDAERQALAAELEIMAVTRADLDARISPRGGGRFRLVGRLEAEAVQVCVVSLDPVEAHLDIALEIDLVPEQELPHELSELEAGTDPVEARLLEPIRNGTMDIGAIVFQEIAAALDPFPRLAGARLDRHEAGPAAADADHPFAKLGTLREPKSGA
jgi:uncharacterized metal-binding protein YceD (DUF177 family)